jgi:DAACS family dicarboxylate/amino acid:cation (Na+ or H+) symporter
MAPLLGAIGLPPEGVGIHIAVDVIPDTSSTVLNVTGNVAATAIVARFEDARVRDVEVADERVVAAR